MKRINSLCLNRKLLMLMKKMFYLSIKTTFILWN